MTYVQACWILVTLLGMILTYIYYERTRKAQTHRDASEKVEQVDPKFRVVNKEGVWVVELAVTNTCKLPIYGLRAQFRMPMETNKLDLFLDGTEVKSVKSFSFDFKPFNPTDPVHPNETTRFYLQCLPRFDELVDVEIMIASDRGTILTVGDKQFVRLLKLPAKFAQNSGRIRRT